MTQHGCEGCPEKERVKELLKKNLFLQRRVHLLYMQMEHDFGLDTVERIMGDVIKEEGE